MEPIINRALIASRYLFWRYESMKAMKMKTLAVLFAIAVGTPFLIGLPTAYAANIYVTKDGSPDPDGSSGKPYQMVEAGIVRANSLPGSTVLIGGGKYYETLTIDTKCTLTATGGTATIGKMDYTASTTLDIITLNTHLAGDQVFMPSWRDCERAEDIADFFGGPNPRPDVVTFQEIWDDDIFLGGDCFGPNHQGLYKEAGYPYGRHGTGTDCLFCANSGLAIMSQYELTYWHQVFWGSASDGYCYGSDCMAAKGWVEAVIVKGGFDIIVLSLHTQADESPDDKAARRKQLAKLRDSLISLRGVFPSRVVFVMGDFNVYGEEAEYRDVLIPYIGAGAGGRDAHRNSPGFDFANPATQDTYSADNPLAPYFSDFVTNGRLDYIFYFPPLDGSVEVQPTYVKVLPFRGRWLSEDGLTTNESSDHWAIHGRFKLIRK